MTASNATSAVRIGVVGGNGQMGQWLRRFWRDLGYEVMFSDCDTQESNEDVVSWADVTFVAVPLQVTPAVIRSLAPAMADTKALVSIASLMGPSASELIELRGEAICAHPVFGPTVRRTAGLPVVVAGVRGDFWRGWLVAALSEAGLEVRETTPEEHDASMAVVQAMLHSTYVALCGAMTSAGLPPLEALDWASPTLRLQLGLIARILGQDPELYADLVVGNTHAPALLDALANELKHLADLAREGDRAGFATAFRTARDGFGDRGDDLASRAEAALEQFT
ncbi:MAG: Prephenate dehydrogenase [Chloroflexi bacterium]|nr:Prephenate dehydrogenase [Chloroflexota bacterium]